MKKILSVALSTAMAFSMFATVAFGADANLSDEQKFNALKEAGVMTGLPDGGSHLEKALSRAELAKIIVKAIDLQPVTGVASYKDKNYTANHWAAPFIEAATQAGIMNGKDATAKLFDPTGNVTVQELAKVLVTALKLEVPSEANNTADSWAKGYVAAAVEKGYLPAGINYQANATRSQAVVAAYAIYQAKQVPTVKSYKVVDSKNVEFTMSDNEVVKVTLEKALEANKETEVKFTYKEKEYTHKVTYVTTVAQKVESVSAKNLKEVVVVFDGTVDKKSGENKLNYDVKDQKVDSVKLSDDKKTATVLLEETSTLTNQKETEIKIKNIKNEDSTKTIEQTVKFTPVDVQIPEVKEVVGLGTSAFKVVFSEPVQKSDVFVSSNFKVDGVSVSGNIEYSYPNVAIVNYNLPVGDHKLTVSNIRDYSGLKIAPVESSFSIVQDSAAPEVVSIKSNDLKEVEIEFNESIKSYGKVYHGVSGNTGTVEKRDNKLIVKFSQPLSLGENTVYIENVSDYSGNKANRDAKVNPTLDTERPTVDKVEVKQDDKNAYHYLEIQFSKKVSKESAEKRTNYTIKDSNGKVVSNSGLDKDGHPFATPSYDDSKNKVTVYLNSKLDNANYTLEVANVVDTAYVANTMLPYSTTFNAKQTVGDPIARVWFRQDGNERNLYIQYRTNVKTSGEGRADLAEKYAVNGQSLKDVEDVTVVSGDTVRIRSLKNNMHVEFDTAGNVKPNQTITAQLIQDVDGNWLKQDGSYTLKTGINTSSKISIKPNGAKATSQTEVKVEFDGKLNSYYVGDFTVKTSTGSLIKPDSAELSNDKMTLTLKFNDNNKLPATLNTGSKLIVASNASTTDAQGGSIETGDFDLKDEIRPDFNQNFSMTRPSATEATYHIILTGIDTVNGPIDPVDAGRVLKVEYNGEKLNIKNVFVNPQNNYQLVIAVDLAEKFDPNKVINIELDGAANQALKAIKDPVGNAFADFKTGAEIAKVFVNTIQ